MQLIIQTKPNQLKKTEGTFPNVLFQKNSCAKNLFAITVICGSSVLCKSSAWCEKGCDGRGRTPLLTTINDKPHLSNRICSQDQYYSFPLV